MLTAKIVNKIKSLTYVGENNAEHIRERYFYYIRFDSTSAKCLTDLLKP